MTLPGRLARPAPDTGSPSRSTAAGHRGRQRFISKPARRRRPAPPRALSGVVEGRTGGETVGVLLILAPLLAFLNRFDDAQGAAWDPFLDDD